MNKKYVALVIGSCVMYAPNSAMGRPLNPVVKDIACTTVWHFPSNFSFNLSPVNNPSPPVNSYNPYGPLFPYTTKIPLYEYLKDGKGYSARIQNVNGKVNSVTTKKDDDFSEKNFSSPLGELKETFD